MAKADKTAPASGPSPETPSGSGSDEAPRAGELTRVRLMDSAIEVLAERGYHAARVDDIV